MASWRTRVVSGRKDAQGNGHRPRATYPGCEERRLRVIAHRPLRSESHPASQSNRIVPSSAPVKFQGVGAVLTTPKGCGR